MYFNTSSHHHYHQWIRVVLYCWNCGHWDRKNKDAQHKMLRFTSFKYKRNFILNAIFFLLMLNALALRSRCHTLNNNAQEVSSNNQRYHKFNLFIVSLFFKKKTL